MGVQERKERDFQRREREILDAALGLFATEDWQAVTVEQIAEQAEIGKGTVYKHFTSKDEIYAHLALEFRQQALAKLEQIDPSLPVIQRLRAIIEVFWEQNRGGEEYHHLAQYCEREDFVRSLPEEIRTSLQSVDQRFRDAIDRVLDDGMSQGILPRKAREALVFGPMAALQGAARMIWGGCLECEPNPNRYREEITNFILAGMLYQEWLADEGLAADETKRRAVVEHALTEAEVTSEGQTNS